MCSVWRTHILWFFFLGCYEERAILLSRIGQHDQALNIYVHKLRNFQAAEEWVAARLAAFAVTLQRIRTNTKSLLFSRYCVKNYDSTDTTKNVYLLLLKVYLKPPNREKPMLEPALDILTRHGSHIDPQAVSVEVLLASFLFYCCSPKLRIVLFSMSPRCWACFQRPRGLINCLHSLKSRSVRATRPRIWTWLSRTCSRPRGCRPRSS